MSFIIKYQLLLGILEDSTIQKFTEQFEKISAYGHVRFDDRLVYARILWVKGSHDAALEQLEDMLGTLRREKIRSYLTEAILLKIRILISLESDRETILNLAREAVHYSYEHDMLFPFIQEGKQIKAIMHELLEVKKQDLRAEEITFIHHICTNDASENQLLTERELDVLRILATGASNKEIGNVLHISVATVKTHLIHIYEKLNASNRLEAVEKARTLHLT